MTLLKNSKLITVLLYVLLVGCSSNSSEIETSSEIINDENIEKFAEIKLVKFIHEPPGYEGAKHTMKILLEVKNLTDNDFESFRIKAQGLDKSGNYLGTGGWLTGSIRANSRSTIENLWVSFDDLSQVSNLLLMEISIYSDGEWWDTQTGNWIINQSNPYNITLEL